jgi:hypothetical protein
MGGVSFRSSRRGYSLCGGNIFSLSRRPPAGADRIMPKPPLARIGDALGRRLHGTGRVQRPCNIFRIPPTNMAKNINVKATEPTPASPKMTK